MSYQKDRDEFVGVIVAEVANKGVPLHQGVHQGTDLARLILRNAATIQRHAIDECNRPTTLRETQVAGRAKQRIIEACKPWGIKPTFGGDPRGACVKLLLPSGRWNSMGGAECGYCVPTR